MKRYLKNPEYLNLLVVEDDEDFILLLRDTIEDIHNLTIKTTFASTLQQSFEYLEHNSFDAILLDLNINDSFGISTFNKIHKTVPSLAIIIHSSNNQEDYIELALSEGAQDYLLKGEYDSKLLSHSLRYSILSKARENELNDSKERYKLLYESNPAPMSIIDESTMQVISVNNVTDKLYGLNAKYLLQQSIDGFIKEMLDANDGSFTEANWESMDWDTWPQYREDGSVFYVDIKSNKIILEGRTCWLNVFHDVTERYTAAEKIRKVTANMTAVLDNTQQGYFLLDCEGGIVIANNTVNRIWDSWDMAPVKAGTKLSDSINEPNKTRFLDRFNRALKGDTVLMEVPYDLPSGKKVWIETTFSPVLAEDGEIIGVCHSINDITLKIEKQQKLEETEANLLAILDNTAQGYFLLDKCGKVLIVNKAAQNIGKILNVPETKEGVILADIVKEEIRKAFLHHFNKALAGEDISFERAITKPDGAKLWLKSFFSPVRTENNQIIGVCHSIRDVTEKMNSLEKLRVIDANLRATLDNTAEGYCLLDLNGNIIIKNKVRDEILAKMEKPPMEIGENIAEKILAPNKEEYLKDFKKALGGETIVSKREYKMPSGGTMWLKATYNPVVSDTGEITSIAHGLKDITEEVLAEQKLRKNEAELRAVFENTVQGYCMLDPHAKVLLFNKKAGAIWNKIDGSVLKEGDRLMEMLPAHRAEKFRDIFNRIINGEILEFEWEHLLPNGEKIWIEYTFNPVTTPDGNIIGVCEGIRDVTARKADQQTLMQYAEELTKANRGQANAIAKLKKTHVELDRFIYCASHEMRGPLTSIMGLINLGIDEADGQQKVYFDMMRSRVTVLDELISDIISHSRNARLPKQIQEIDLLETLRCLLNEYQYAVPSNFNFELDINNDHIFLSDQEKIKMIINALLSNSIKYSDNSKESPFVNITVNVDNKYAAIKVCDNGIGIDSTYKDKIFNMFYRATDVASGSGLGLYILKEAVETLEGSIKVESELGKGSCFTVLIPNLASKDKYLVA